MNFSNLSKIKTAGAIFTYFYYQILTMDEQSFIYSLPFHISLKGNKSIDLHFSNSSRHFNVKCKVDKPSINISLIGPDGIKKEFDYHVDNSSINGRGYDRIKFENKSDGEVLITLDR